MTSPEDRTPAGRLRLLVAASTFPARADDGTPAFVRDLAAYEAREFDTVVLVPRVAGAARSERIGGYTVERFRYFPRRFEDLADGSILANLRARPSRWLQLVPFLCAETLALRRLVRAHRPDVLHLYWIVPQGVAALLSAPRVPWVVTTLGGDVYALQHPAAALVKRAVLRRARSVTVMSEDMGARVVGLGARPADTHVMPMGIDLSLFRAAPAGIARLPGRLLFAGRLVEKKGLAVLLTALRRMPPDVDWSLDVVGDGPLRGELEESAGGLPVRFLGQLGRDELAAAYVRSEVVVVPSVRATTGDQDGLPVVLMEAMAAGCAVVASTLPGIDAAVVDERSGLLVPPGDPGALAGALARVLRDAQLRERLGAAAGASAGRFSLDVVGRGYVQLLRRAAGTPRPDRRAGGRR